MGLQELDIDFKIQASRGRNLGLGCRACGFKALGQGRNLRRN